MASVFRVLEVDPAARGFEPRLHTELTGRGDALTAIDEMYESVIADRACRALTLVGEPGIGKTRLAEEFTAGVSTEALVLRAGCPSYGEGITFRPIVQVVRLAAGIAEGEPTEEVNRALRAIVPKEALRPLADLLALPGEVPRPEETFRAIRRLLEALAADRPLVIVFDDLHWAEPALLDLLEYVTKRTMAPVLLLGTARPELLEGRPGWGAEPPRSTVMQVTPLPEADARLLAVRLLGSPQAAGDVDRSIVRTAGGNPLFVEELVAMLLDQGALETGAPSRPGRGGDRDVLPLTIHALLQARLDLLPPIERTIAETASIEGTSFHLGAVLALAEDELDEASLDAAVRSLLGRDFLRPDRSTLPRQRAFRFRHELIRDAAYASVPKASRALLHEGFACWLEGAAGTQLGEREAVIGRHLEQACLLHRELGHADDAAPRNRASEHLANAGRRSLERGDARSAAGLLQRAVDLLPVGGRERTRLLWPLAEALDLATGRFAHVGEELESSARALGDEVLRQAGRLLMLGDRWATDPRHLDLDEYARITREALALFEATEASEFAYWGWVILATVHWYRGDMTAALDAAERMLWHLGRSGRHAPLLLLGYLWHALRLGPTPLPEAASRLEREMAARADDPVATAWLQLNMAILRAMQGRFDEATSLAAASGTELEGLPQHLLDTTTMTADIAWFAGDLDEAERGYRADLEAEFASEDLINTAAAAVSLAEVLVREGAIDEAAAVAEVAQGYLAPYDTTTRIDLERIRSSILTAEGRPEEAARAAAEAVALAEGTDMLETQGECLLALAEVEGAAGDLGAAMESARRALERFERKGFTIRVAEAQALLDRLAG